MTTDNVLGNINGASNSGSRSILKKKGKYSKLNYKILGEAGRESSSKSVRFGAINNVFIFEKNGKATIKRQKSGIINKKKKYHNINLEKKMDLNIDSKRTRKKLPSVSSSRSRSTKKKSYKI